MELYLRDPRFFDKWIENNIFLMKVAYTSRNIRILRNG